MKGSRMRLNVLLAVLAAAVLAVFAVLYFVMVGGSGDEAENGLSIEEQTPRIEQKPDETPTQTAIETPAPERPEESASPKNPAEETAAPSDNGGESAATDAPEADAPDAFAVQLQEAVQELGQLAHDLKDKFSGSDFAAATADMFANLGADLARIDAESRQQNLPRQERIAKLRERYMETGKKFDAMERDPNLSDADDEVATYLGGIPTPKIFTLLEMGP